MLPHRRLSQESDANRDQARNLDQKATGHCYFLGKVDKSKKLVEVQFHSNQYIGIKSLQHDIIPKTGIPESYWKKWANVGNKKARKLVQYKGAAMVKD